MIIRATTGERFLCQTEANLQEAVMHSKPIKITNIYSVVTVSIMGQMGPSRMTALEYPDLQDEEILESMMIMPAAWYKFPDERADAEIKELTDSMAKAKEFRKAMEERASSQIEQVQTVPAVPGMLGSLGSLVKPPGVR
jgi:hypothetical protein